ncbi:hypothetical protein BD410DRAFT_807642 [Rickenella mellea]|uniref:Uncharacterized protein n=1 Tax=Rickenella mellea TaxID=50990 RepID=A0A4Y7PNU5_9AGAM|nr:hypothetical protein BD410DRAFT_807642 [Rickenella mellea]
MGSLTTDPHHPLAAINSISDIGSTGIGYSGMIAYPYRGLDVFPNRITDHRSPLAVLLVRHEITLPPNPTTTFGAIKGTKTYSRATAITRGSGLAGSSITIINVLEILLRHEITLPPNPTTILGAIKDQDPLAHLHIEGFRVRRLIPTIALHDISRCGSHLVVFVFRTSNCCVNGVILRDLRRDWAKEKRLVFVIIRKRALRCTLAATSERKLHVRLVRCGVSSQDPKYEERA